MLKPTGTMVLRVNYVVNDDDRTVRIQHPSLSGALGFEYTSLDLAEVQLEALRMDKTKSVIEEVIDNTTELIGLAGELRTALSELKKNE